MYLYVRVFYLLIFFFDEWVKDVYRAAMMNEFFIIYFGSLKVYFYFVNNKLEMFWSMLLCKYFISVILFKCLTFSLLFSFYAWFFVRFNIFIEINFNFTSLAGKTRTKDKYRVVYTDHQRLELEKEFHYTRYITIRRKAELAQTLALSERQVKIWVS